MPNTATLRHRLALYLDLIRWNRPAGWLLLLWPSLSGLWLAQQGFPGWYLTLTFVAGTVLMRSAGCCINDVADRAYDRHVKRTAQRPVTRGAIAPKEALAVGGVLALTAFLLVLTTNWLTVVASFVALAISIVYPYTKRFFSMPQAVLGIAFSFGIPMAFAAVNGGALGEVWHTSPWQAVSMDRLWQAVPAQAWWMLLGNLFWVLAYDTEYAMVDRDDDLKIGMKTSAITMGRWDVSIVMACYGMWLLIWSVLLAPHVDSGWGLVGLGLCVGQIGWHYALIRHRDRHRCFEAFKQNHWLGMTAFMVLVLSG
jgi:4-hydroxybenzoate polyprenyltransferase